MGASAQLLPQTQSSIPAHWKVPLTLRVSSPSVGVSSPSVGKVFFKPSQTCQETYLYGDLNLVKLAMEINLQNIQDS